MDEVNFVVTLKVEYGWFYQWMEGNKAQMKTLDKQAFCEFEKITSDGDNGIGSKEGERSSPSEFQFSSVQLLSCVQLFATPWTAARQSSLSITNSQNLLKLMSI